MDPKSNLMIKISICAALFFLVGFSCRQTLCLADEAEPAQVEAVVINVDQWAVYVPDRVFYFDTNGDKKKIESLRRAANRLRNKRALITYYSPANPSRDNRAILSDIVPAGNNPNSEKPVQETAKPADVSQTKVTPNPAEQEKPLPSQTVPSQSPITDKQVAAFVEALRQAAPHTGNPNDGLYSDWKVKAGNILRWSKQCMGREMDPAEFAANPPKAREVVTFEMGKILRREYAISNDIYVAVCRAASWWMTGDPGKYDTPPTSSYTTKVLGYYMRAL
ncbi:MAG: hypothetical protein P4L43_08505 [Syntrophobacteraceae bacterium]|nr:hypothetical protein [Syntrophobacteraceae bacterium]